MGGGSGGHVTPVVAVLKELRNQDTSVELKFWCDTTFAPQARAIISDFDASIPVETIVSGKLRRYHHLTVWQHLLWPSLLWHNFVDVFKVIGGFIQSVWKLVWWRPDVVFTKGGYVCLPVGIAAKALGIPLVIHDSDAHPGLTNRVLSRFASRIATGAPLEYYSYPPAIAEYVGIPVHEAFRPFTMSEQKKAKRRWGVSQTRPLVVVTGGGLGARRLNNTTLEVLPKLQQVASVILVSGEGHYATIRHRIPHDSESFKLYKFVTNMYDLLGAADVVVTRAGATTIQELASLKKATILVPNAALTGGHQTKNAAVYGDAQVAIVLNEDELVDNPDQLVEAVTQYLDNPKLTHAMVERFGSFAKPDAAKNVARLILSSVR